MFINFKSLIRIHNKLNDAANFLKIIIRTDINNYCIYNYYLKIYAVQLDHEKKEYKVIVPMGPAC